MASLLRRIFGKRPTAEHLTFTVYTRAQCGCCHKAMDVLEDFRERYGFRIETVDVDGDPELAAKYGDRFRAPQSLRDMAARGESFPALRREVSFGGLRGHFPPTESHLRWPRGIRPTGPSAYCPTGRPRRPRRRSHTDLTDRPFLRQK